MKRVIINNELYLQDNSARVFLPISRTASCVSFAQVIEESDVVAIGTSVEEIRLLCVA